MSDIHKITEEQLAKGDKLVIRGRMTDMYERDDGKMSVSNFTNIENVMRELLVHGAFFGELEHHVGSYCVVFFQCAVRYSSIPHLAPVATKFWQQSLGYMHPPVRAMIAYTYCTHSHAALCSSSAYLHYLMKDHLSPNPSLLSRRRLLRAV